MKRIGMLALTVMMGLNAALGSERSVFGVFCGSSPCGEAVRRVLRIATKREPELIEWKLTLYGERENGHALGF
jgi:hypothetical protein